MPSFINNAPPTSLGRPSGTGLIQSALTRDPASAQAARPVAARNTASPRLAPRRSTRA